MITLLADENFHGAMIKGLRRKDAGVDIVRVQEVGLMGASDPEILEWAAQTDRILLTHDVKTIIGYPGRERIP